MQGKGRYLLLKCTSSLWATQFKQRGWVIFWKCTYMWSQIRPLSTWFGMSHSVQTPAWCWQMKHLSWQVSHRSVAAAGGISRLTQIDRNAYIQTTELSFVSLFWIESQCFGLVWQRSHSSRSNREGFSEKLPEASSHPTEPRSAGSKMDPLLATARPISSGGNGFVITYLKRKNKVIGQK